MNWYENHDEILRLATWLVHHDGTNTEELLYYLEKPWKYETERNEMLKENA